MKKRIILSILSGLFCIVANAQIGYQVALLNSATGKPRANETVNADIKITDSKDDVIYSGTQSITSNDFGILSFTIGNNTTFQDLATRAFPLYISVTVNGVLIGKSQILSVPMAEVANSLKSDIDLDELCKTWIISSNEHYGEYRYLSFYKDGTASYLYYYNEELLYSWDGYYEIEGNNIFIYHEEEDSDFVEKKLSVCRIRNGMLFFIN